MLVTTDNSHVCQQRNGPLHRTWQRPLDHWRRWHWNSVEQTRPHPAFYHAQQCYAVYWNQRDQPPGVFKLWEKPCLIVCKKGLQKLRTLKRWCLHVSLTHDTKRVLWYQKFWQKLKPGSRGYGEQSTRFCHWNSIWGERSQKAENRRPSTQSLRLALQHCAPSFHQWGSGNRGDHRRARTVLQRDDHW